MKKINIIKSVILLFTLSIFISCDEGGDPDPGATAIAEIAGDWVVNITRDGADYAHDHISTYNTSANSITEMWLDDQQHGWGLKAKVNLDLASKTFSGTDLEETYFDVTVTVTDGQIITDGATAPSGTVTDSITFTAEFSDIPGEIWVYSGYRRTGFLEDE
ncbi:lipid-binding protein [Flavivirga amylovorans]|uniref:Lipid-binding protein n=1 Tax=Flavivirga amylovorans TaxID=870486 RepID=A0ABT8WWE4_9FLAO|nr:lipid-binding protein [Flavivirga amylovorans]MDO5985993.1 lipid-binding protein [Flavivirga amylovorans]